MGLTMRFCKASGCVKSDNISLDVTRIWRKQENWTSNSSLEDGISVQGLGPSLAHCHCRDWRCCFPHLLISHRALQYISVLNQRGDLKDPPGKVLHQSRAGASKSCEFNVLFSCCQYWPKVSVNQSETGANTFIYHKCGGLQTAV